MKIGTNMEEELAVLQKEKGNICITVISPTHRLSPERRTDQVRLEKAIKRANDYLQTQYDGKNLSSHIQAMDELYRGIDFNNNTEGVGLFVSAGIKKLVQFSFPINEKVIIGNSFEIRDLLYEAYYNRPYAVLLLSEKAAKLFNGRLNTLTEVTDDHFPQNNTSEYEYNKASRGYSNGGNAFVKEVEKDNSILEEIRFQNFFRQIDALLTSYVGNQTPLIVASAEKNLAHFRKITQHDKNVVSYISGNYFLSAPNELGDLSWTQMKVHLDNEKEDLIKDFNEKIGEGLGVTGIQDIWKAAKEGKGFKLLVERDFSLPGFIINEEEYHLYLHPPKRAHQVLPDAVNELIEIVLEKKGEVVMVENDRLRDHARIALITRY